MRAEDICLHGMQVSMRYVSLEDTKLVLMEWAVDGVGEQRGAGPLAKFARRPLRTVDVAAAAEVFRQPRQQLARLARRGLLHRTARGFYVVVPQEYVGTTWLPELEAVAAGIGVAIYGPDDAILMGVSAARVHGTLPRALAVALVAVPQQRPVLRLSDRDATIRFVTRSTARLDAEMVRTELGKTLVTSAEQTVLDLARRPNLGDAAVDVPAAIRGLYPRCSPEVLRGLAVEQRMQATLGRVSAIVGDQ